MKTHRLTAMIGLAVLGLAFGACSKESFQQDPLANQPENIRKGVPPEEDKVPPPAKPYPQEALRITAPDFHDFREGVEGSFTIKGRVLKPGTDVEIIVENLQKFPGARVEPVDENDPSAGLKFVWRPEISASSIDYTTKQYLDLMLATTNTPERLTVKKTVILLVTRQTRAPEIVEVEDLTKAPLREGEDRTFQVVVKDLDGVDGGSGAAEGLPRLQVVANRSDEMSVSHMVSLVDQWGVQNPVRDPNDGTRWIFKMTLNAKNREVTGSEGSFYFALQAHSRFGIPSVRKVVEAKIRTSIREPVISWKEPVTVLGGEDMAFNFTAYDPAAEGKVSVNFLTRPDLALGQAAWDCPPQNAVKEPLVCTIRWRVPADPQREIFEIPMEIRNKSVIPGDKTETVVRVIGQLKVQKPLIPPPPAPTPAPPPSATPVPAPGGASRPVPSPFDIESEVALTGSQQATNRGGL